MITNKSWKEWRSEWDASADNVLIDCGVISPPVSSLDIAMQIGIAVSIHKDVPQDSYSITVSKNEAHILVKSSTSKIGNFAVACAIGHIIRNNDLHDGVKIYSIETSPAKLFASELLTPDYMLLCRTALYGRSATKMAPEFNIRTEEMKYALQRLVENGDIPWYSK